MNSAYLLTTGLGSRIARIAGFITQGSNMGVEEKNGHEKTASNSST